MASNGKGARALRMTVIVAVASALPAVAALAQAPLTLRAAPVTAAPPVGMPYLGRSTEIHLAAYRRKSSRLRRNENAKTEQNIKGEPTAPAIDAAQSKAGSKAPAPVLNPVKTITPAAPAVPAATALPVTGSPDGAAPPPVTQWSDAEIISALRQCLAVLAPLGVEIEPADPMRNGACGDAAPVKLKSAGVKDRVRFDPPVEVNCALASRLAAWIESDLQPAAREMMSVPVSKITGASGYSCRNRYGLANAPLSEHATGNAVDIPGFVFANGKSVRLASSWGVTARDLAARERAISDAGKGIKTAVPRGGEAKVAGLDPVVGAAQKITESAPEKLPEKLTEKAAGKTEVRPPAKTKSAALKPASIDKPVAGSKRDFETPPQEIPIPSTATSAQDKPTAEGLFLRRVYKASCERFGTVLGPEANEAHRDHFHLDIKARKKKAYCQ